MSAAVDRLQLAWKRHRAAATVAGCGLACLFAALSVARCRFLRTAAAAAPGSSVAGASVGLFSRPFYDERGDRLGCVAHGGPSDAAPGALLRTARAFGVLAALLSGLSVLFTAAVAAWKPPKWSDLAWNAAKYALVGAAMCQMMTFMVLGDPELCGSTGCTLVGVGVLAVFNTLMLAALSLAFIFLPLPVSPWLVWWQRVGDDDDEGADESVKDATALSSSQQASGAIRDYSYEVEEDGVSIICSSVSQQSNQQRSSIHIVTSIQELTSFRLITVALLVVACSVSVVGVNRCTFLLVGPRQGSLTTSSTFTGKGLFSQAIHDINGDFLGCVAYSSQTISEFDAAFRTGRAFGAITALFMTTALVLGTVQLFCHSALRKRIWFSFRLFLPVVTVSQLIAFTAFGSNICQGIAECRPGGTGVVVILNIFLLATLSLLVCLVPPPLNPVFKFLRIQHADEVDQQRADIQLQPVEEISTEIGRIRHYEGPVGADLTESYDTDSDELYYGWNATPKKTIPKQKPTTERDGVESIEVRVEYTETERKTIKTINHRDGSKTITTRIEELESESSLGDEDDDY